MPLKSEKSNTQRRTNYFEIDNDYVLLYAKHLGVTATAVYTSLCMHADYVTGRSWPSMELIAEQHGLERHAVSRALIKLEKWNLIKVEKAIDRKKRKRKNNVYTLIKKEFWKEIPLKVDGAIDSLEIDGHCTKSTVDMVVKVPQHGTQDTGNKTHITKINEQDTNCEQGLTLSISPLSKVGMPGHNDFFSVEKTELEICDNNKRIAELSVSDYIDYRIIGYYFIVKELSFDNKEAFDMAFRRALKPAQMLKAYKTKDIGKTMNWCKDSYGVGTGWTLETVVKRIDDCIANDFAPQKTSGSYSPPKWDQPAKGKYDNLTTKKIT